MRECSVSEMILVEFDYGDFLRAEFTINPERGWRQGRRVETLDLGMGRSSRTVSDAPSPLSHANPI